jgi:hypothetical protein
VDGDLRFPAYTWADDTLDFRVGPQRIRLTIHYSDYKRFAAESTVQFADPVAAPAGRRAPAPTSPAAQAP